MKKADYVLRQKSDGKHTCHWPGCTRKVSPAKWGCREHWFKLPKHLRDEIWRTFTPGQEVTKRPSQEYLEVARRVREWISARQES